MAATQSGEFMVAVIVVLFLLLIIVLRLKTLPNKTKRHVHEFLLFDCI
jgi:hypothetical protein